MERPKGNIPLVGCPVEFRSRPGVSGYVSAVTDARDIMRQAPDEYGGLARSRLATMGESWANDWYRATVTVGQAVFTDIDCSDLKVLDPSSTRAARR